MSETGNSDGGVGIEPDPASTPGVDQGDPNPGPGGQVAGNGEAGGSEGGGPQG